MPIVAYSISAMLNTYEYGNVYPALSAHRGGSGLQPGARVRGPPGSAGAAAGVHGHARAAGARVGAAGARHRRVARAPSRARRAHHAPAHLQVHAGTYIRTILPQQPHLLSSVHHILHYITFVHPWQRKSVFRYLNAATHTFI